jgi:hypothetical protein
MNIDRDAHTATLLPNGHVLVAARRQKKGLYISVTIPIYRHIGHQLSPAVLPAALAMIPGTLMQVLARSLVSHG